MKKRIYSRALALALCLGLMLRYGYAAPAEPGGAAYAAQPQAAGAEHIIEHDGKLRELMESGKVHDGDTIIVRGFAHVGSTSELGDNPFVIDKAVTIRGEEGHGHTPTVVLRLGGILLEKDVVFENIEISFSNRRRNVIMANGHKLTLKNVKRSSGAREVNLACGGLVGGPIQSQPGEHGEIIISGWVNLGNIYAGNIAHTEWRGSANADPGIANDFAKSATIRVEELHKDSIMGNVYASGGRQIPIDPSHLFDQTETPPPTVDPSRFTVSGDVDIYLYEGKARAVDGKTGGSKNADVILDGSYLVNNMSLSNLGSLAINSGKFAPTINDDSLANGSLTVADGAKFDFAKVQNKTVGRFDGGGMIVLGVDDVLQITGETIGATKVAIGGTNNAETESTVIPLLGHTYIAAKASKAGAFQLLAHGMYQGMHFERDTEGNWKTKDPSFKSVKVKTASIENVSVDGQDGYAELPVKATYVDEAPDRSLAQVPVEIKVNSKTAAREGSEYTAFEYTLGEQGIGTISFVDNYDSGLSLFIDSKDGIFETGNYQIDVVIPASHMENNQELHLTCTMEVHDGITPKPPEKFDLANADVTISTTGNFVYNKGEHRPEIAVTANGKTLEKDVDYIVDYANNINAGEATVTVKAVEGSGYTGSKTASFTIAPAPLTLHSAEIAAKTYDGTADATVTKLVFHNASGAEEMLSKDVDYTVNARFNAADVNAASSVTVTVNLSGKAAQNYVLQNNTLTVRQTIEKSSIEPQSGKMDVTNRHAAEYTYDLRQLLASLDGGKKYGNITFTVKNTDLGQYRVGQPSINNTTMTLPIAEVASDAEEEIGTVTIGITTDNYTVRDALIRVSAVNKTVPVGKPRLSTETITYGDRLSSITLSGEMTDGADQTIAGEFVWTDPNAQLAAGSAHAEWTFKPIDTERYQTVNGQAAITVNKAVPTGAPRYTAITEDKKTLADAKINADNGVFSVPGTVKWDLAQTTEVVKNTAYSWTFTPTDAANYEIVQGSITLYSSSGGSGGGSGGGGGGISGGGGGGSLPDNNGGSGTENNPDGSTTTVEKKSDGTTITTTKHPDGAVSKVETKKDGTAIETNTTANGTVGKIVADVDGNITEISGKVSDKDAQQAQQNGESVKLPIRVPAASDAARAPEVKVDVPKGGSKVEIPTEKLTAGTVAVIVHRDGTEEIVRESGLTAEGVTLTLESSATLKLVDNSKQYDDVRGFDWHKDAVSFISARELMNGTSSYSFSPNAELSRGMLAVIIHNMENNPKAAVSGGLNDVHDGEWYADAVYWAKEKGILTGYADGAIHPNDNITREQLAVMLYRYAGSPAVSHRLTGFTDSQQVSGYAGAAMTWAVENGVLSGKGDGKLDPRGEATRAETAQMLMNLMK